MKSQRRLLMLKKTSTKKAILNKDFRQAIMFAFNRKAYVAQTNGEAGANKVIRNTFTPPNFVQIDGKQFGDAVEKTWKLMGMNGKGSLSQMEKTPSTIQTRPKKSLPKPRQTCRLKELNSQFIWTFQLLLLIRKELNRPNPLNNQLSLHWEQKILSLI